MHADRIEALEIKVAWLEKQVSELDGVLRETCDHLERLRRELGEMRTGLQDMEHAFGVHEKPPHY